MSQAPRPSNDELARQLRQRLDSLRAAGVEWLPRQVALPASSEVAAAPAPEEEPMPKKAATAPRNPTSPEQRLHALEMVAAKVSTCPRCDELVRTRTQTVFGVGPLDAELCFIGEAPGADEDKKGEPFVGAAGQLLNRIIAACGMERKDVYICNIIKCRPPGNRQPLPQEAANCREYLDRQLELVKPKYICALGATAAQNLLGTTQTIGKLRNKLHDYKGIPVWCTYHPAYLLRSPEKKKDVWDDMKALLAKMGKRVPK